MKKILLSIIALALIAQLALAINISPSLEKTINENGSADVAVVLKSGTPQAVSSSLASIKNFRVYNTFNGFSATITKADFEKLRRDRRVKSIQQDEIYETALEQSLPIIQGDQAQALGFSGAGQAVCILDTGIDTDHYAFQDRIVGQHCFCRLNNSDGFPCCPNNQAEDDNAEDDRGHGTHVAGIIAGDFNTFAGVAPEANIIAVKVCSANSLCSGLDIINGIDWCVTQAEQHNISVISASIAGGGFTNYCDANVPSLATVINAASEQNISFVAASGNNGFLDKISSPACVQNAVPVGSTDDGSSGTTPDTISSFTNRAQILELLAPGRWITSAWNNGGLSTMQGTSMATPHVSGAILLLNQLAEEQGSTQLTPTQAEIILKNSGQPIFDYLSNKTYYRINVLNALNLADVYPPAQAFNITLSTRSATSLSWNWQTADDVALTKVYLNGVFKFNTSDTNATFYELQPNAPYTLGLETVDLNGNVNTDVITHTAQTLPDCIRVAAPPSQTPRCIQSIEEDTNLRSLGERP